MSHKNPLRGKVRQKRQIRGVAFDLEGNAINQEVEQLRAHVFAARDHGIKITLPKLIEMPYVIGGGDDRIIEILHSMSNRQVAKDTLKKAKGHHFERLTRNKKVSARPGFEERLQWLGKKGYSISIGSLTDRNRALMLLERSGIIRYFRSDCIVLKEDVDNLKPFPDVYLETAKRMGIDPSQQLVFEDSATGIEAARMANSFRVAMPVLDLAVDHYFLIDRLLQAGAQHIFKDWRLLNLGELIRYLEKHGK